MLDRFVPATRLARLATIVFLLVATSIAWCARNEHSGFILLTAPSDPTFASNSLLGFSYTEGELPLHKENVSFMNQVLLFSGSSAPVDMYSVRAGYSFAASFLQPFFDLVHALWLTNCLCWAVAAWATWRFTVRLFSDELAGVVSVALVSAGMGMTVHVGDYSAHLMAFTVYYVLVLAIYESEVWCRERPLGTHLRLGLALALACLEYNTGICLVVGYVAVSWRQNRRAHLLLAATIALTAQRLWVFHLNHVIAWLNGPGEWIDFYATERDYLSRSVAQWRALLAEGVGTFLGALVTKTAEFFFFDSPLVVAAGAVTLAFLPKKPHLRWLFFVFLVLPYAAALPYACSALARGYIVYGASILLYAALGGAFARAARAPGKSRALALLALGLVFGTHLLWNTEHLRGHTGPAKLYLIGTKAPRSLVLHPTIALSLTGEEPTPALFGGDADLLRAGVFVAPRREAAQGSLLPALAARGFFFIYLVPLLLLLAPTNRARAEWTLAALAVLAVSTQLSVRTLHEKPAVTNIENAFSVPGGQSLRYTVTLSRAFVTTLAEHAEPGDSFEVHLCLSEPRAFNQPGHPTPRIALGEHPLALTQTDPSTWSSPVPEALDALRRSRELTLTVEAVEGEVTVGGWQRAGLPGRRLVAPFLAEPRVLPSFEVRLRKSDGRLDLAGF